MVTKGIKLATAVLVAKSTLVHAVVFKKIPGLAGKMWAGIEIQNQSDRLLLKFDTVMEIQKEALTEAWNENVNTPGVKDGALY